MSSDLPTRVHIVEVGPRDGLQNEVRQVATADKIAFVDALTDAGHHHIEVTSMVRPDRVPQLADAEEVFRAVRKKVGVRYTVLVPNRRGLERALAVDARSVAVFTAASESFSKRNTGMTIRQSLEVIEEVMEVIEEVTRHADTERLALRAYISTAFVCPYDGPVAADAVVGVLRSLRELGIDTFSIGDTVGEARPEDVERLLDAMAEHSPSSVRHPFDGLALHLHDTHGQALENVRVGLSRGVDTFDSSAGGLGGCPFAPGASGNLSTESLVAMLDAMGIETGIDLDRQQRASQALMKSTEGGP